MGDFHGDLERSKSPELQAIANAAIREYFFGLDIKIEFVEDVSEQKKGIDKLVYLSNGRVVKLEEKLRDSNYEDVLIEAWSTFFDWNDKRNRDGWIRKTNQEAELLLYVFPNGDWLIVPFALLQTTWKRHSAAWHSDERIGKKVARDGTKKSMNAAIPFDILIGALKKTAQDMNYSGFYYCEGSVHASK